MAETIGKITNIKVNSFLQGTVNAFDLCNITVKEAGTGTSWLFHLWQSRDDAPAVNRVIESQRLALVRPDAGLEGVFVAGQQSLQRCARPLAVGGRPGVVRRKSEEQSDTGGHAEPGAP